MHGKVICKISQIAYGMIGGRKAQLMNDKWRNPDERRQVYEQVAYTKRCHLFDLFDIETQLSEKCTRNQVRLKAIKSACPALKALEKNR